MAYRLGRGQLASVQNVPPINQHLKGCGKGLAVLDGANDGSEKLPVRRDILAKRNRCLSDCIDSVTNSEHIG